MINAAETQPPKTQIGEKVNAGDTISPGSAAQSALCSVLRVGESVGDGYIIDCLMDKQGKQSNVYLARKCGKTYVIKIYYDKWRPSNQIQSFLTSVYHPNIAHVIECGDYNGYYYEIYEHFAEGTLEEVGALSSTHIQNVIVPSINEGLHELHTNGILHSDIKPSNLFYTNGCNQVVIGDCGISSFVNSDGKLIDTVRGTPEYSPRVKTLLGSAVMSPAYDYGSFGLVLCRVVLGYSIFEGMSVEEISRAWENGLELPSQIRGRLGDLINGLLNEEEEQRWGYGQVKRWCEGEYLSIVNRNIYAKRKKENQNKPLIFGRFDGQTISVVTLHQLEQAIRKYWTQATRVIKRRELIDFVRQFDRSLTDKIMELMLCQDTDAAVYKLLLYIGDNSQRIFYCGKEYESLADYVKQLSTGRDEIAKKFLSTGLLVFYLRYNEYQKSQVDQLEAFIRRNGSNDMASISTICLALQGEKTIDLFGMSVESLDEVIPVLGKCSVEEIDELLCNDKFIAWLNRMGYEEEMRKMKEAFL